MFLQNFNLVEVPVREEHEEEEGLVEVKLINLLFDIVAGIAAIRFFVSDMYLIFVNVRLHDINLCM